MADENDHFGDCCDYRQLSPEKLKELLHCFVRITLVEGEEVQGWVYTIDPVSHTIVIASDSDDNDTERADIIDPKQIVFVTSKAVRELCVVKTARKEPQWLQSFAVKEKEKFTGEELRKKKTNLMDWLHKNRVPILDNSADRDVLHLVGGLVVEPPYDVDSCKGTNEIVLARIRRLISSMPDG